MADWKPNGVTRLIGVIITIVILIVGVGVAYGELRARVNNNEKDITEMKGDLNTIQRGVEELLRRTPANE